MFYQFTIQGHSAALVEALRRRMGKPITLRHMGNEYKATVLEGTVMFEDSTRQLLTDALREIDRLRGELSAPKKRKKRAPKPVESPEGHRDEDGVWHGEPAEVVEGDPVLEGEGEKPQTTPVIFSLPRLKPA